jgi:hypothetical protein
MSRAEVRPRYNHQACSALPVEVLCSVEPGAHNRQHVDNSAFDDWIGVIDGVLRGKMSAESCIGLRCGIMHSQQVLLRAAILRLLDGQ